MARARLISRSLSTSQRFAALHDEIPKLAEFAQVLYMLLITHSDDHGREAGDPFTVKHAVMPTSPRRISAIETALAAMHNVGLVVWYEVDGRKWLQIQDFDEHQSGLHKRTGSHLPEPPGNSGMFPLKRTEQKRTEEKGTEGSLPDGFVRWYAGYPKKKARADALKAWGQVAPDEELVATMIAAVAAQSQTREWTKEKGEFVPLPASWLRGRRWDDVEAVGLVVEPAPVGPPDIWQQALERIQSRIGHSAYVRHFQGSILVSDNGDGVTVQVAHESDVAWIEKHYRTVVQEALAELDRPDVGFRLVAKGSTA